MSKDIKTMLKIKPIKSITEKTDETLVITSENKPARDEKGRLLPGNTANPNGRPEGSISITAEIKKKLQQIPEGKQKTYLVYLVEQILKKAVIDGDQQMIKQIWSYVDGLPHESLSVDGSFGIEDLMRIDQEKREKMKTSIS